MYHILPMKAADLPRVLSLWHEQFKRYCQGDEFPDFLRGGKDTLTQYCLRQIEKDQAIVAVQAGHVVGYMAWMGFDFHGERTAFLPIVGNAATAEDENEIYQALYRTASRRWVQEKRFNHLWMTFYDDAGLRDRLYDIGFGSYVIDACRRTSPNIPFSTKTSYHVKRAEEADAGAVLTLGNEAERNLLEAPVFLVRESWIREEIVRLIHDQQVFAAWDQNRMVGVLSVQMHPGDHLEHLTGADSAYIGGIGAYIRPEYRGKGLGTQLLHHAMEVCHNTGKSFLHVSFESANPDAIRFWPKYFKPAIRSVRRAVNKDAYAGR